MHNNNHISRRTILKTGMMSVAAGTAFVPSAHAYMPDQVKPKAAGETKVVYLGGDQIHNGIEQEGAMRHMAGRAGWRIIFSRDARYITPELISDADLLIITRWGGGIAGWVQGPLFEEKRTSDNYMTDELEDAIVDNVINRGMGFMALHCTIWTPDKKKFINMLGIRPYMHGPIQRQTFHNFNQSHPISKGLTEFDLALDENFGVELINKNAVRLYETTGYEDHRHDIGGWCLENGKGRIVGLGAGHTSDPWRHPQYSQMHWRGAHWAMKRDIPPFE